MQGWLRPSGGLWVRGQQVYVRSPMLIMDQTLLLKAVSFTQDSETGTRSTLELVNILGNRAADVGPGADGGPAL